MKTHNSKKTQAIQVMDLVSSGELFHDDKDNAYIRIKCGDIFSVWSITGYDFKSYLTHLFYKKYNRIISDRSMTEAINSLEGKAKYESSCKSVYSRVANKGDKIYIDLCDDFWRVVEITKSGWSVLDKSPVAFVRHSGMKSLPTPSKGGKVEDISKFVNVRPEEFPLVYGWLLGAFRGKAPFPILLCQGSQGSGKTFLLKVLKELVDPSTVQVIAIPKPADFHAVASNVYVLALDNLSDINAESSDILCRLSTGAGMMKRKLFTDNELHAVELARPILINGIDDIVTRGDLFSRCFHISLPDIPDREKTSETQFFDELKKKKSKLLGAIFDMLSAGLRKNNSVKKKSKKMPVRKKSKGRLIDLKSFIIAAEHEMNMPTLFEDAYDANIDKGIRNIIVESLIGEPILSFMEKRERWEGTALDLLENLHEITSAYVTRSPAWPKSPNVLSRCINRIAPQLEHEGILFQKRHSGVRTITLTKVSSGSDFKSSKPSKKKE